MLDGIYVMRSDIIVLSEVCIPTLDGYADPDLTGRFKAMYGFGLLSITLSR